MSRTKNWYCPKCGFLPDHKLVKIKGNKHVCIICSSDVTWDDEDVPVDNAECDICLFTPKHTPSIGYCFEDSDTDDKTYVCREHLKWAEGHGYLVFSHVDGECIYSEDEAETKMRSYTVWTGDTFEAKDEEDALRQFKEAVQGNYMIDIVIEENEDA